MKKETLDEVFSTNEYLKDSIKVTKRTINREDIPTQVHNKTVFFGNRKDIILEKLDFVIEDLENIMVLSLFSAFERELRIYIQDQVKNNFRSKDNEMLKKLKEEIDTGIERWAINDILDVFKTQVDSQIIGQIKQIYEYRNWVAHGKNQQSLPSSRTDAKTCYKILIEFINQLSKDI